MTVAEILAEARRIGEGLEADGLTLTQAVAELVGVKCDEEFDETLASQIRHACELVSSRYSKRVRVGPYSYAAVGLLHGVALATAAHRQVQIGRYGALAEAAALIETAESEGYVGVGWCEDARSWRSCWADVIDGKPEGGDE